MPEQEGYKPCDIGIYYHEGLGEHGWPDVILGDNFMRAYFVSFDKQN